MRIKKMYQGTIPNNKIVNEERNSQTDTYSCDYINKMSKVEYAIFTTDIAQTVGSGYSVNLNVTSYTTTTRLSISNGKIKIGPNVSKIRVSGGIFIDITTATTGSGYLWSQLRKNGYNQITSISPLVNSMYYLTGILPTRIIPVVEGDTLELISDLTGSQGKIRAGAQDTFICVEIIE